MLVLGLGRNLNGVTSVRQADASRYSPSSISSTCKCRQFLTTGSRSGHFLLLFFCVSITHHSSSGPFFPAELGALDGNTHYLHDIFVGFATIEQLVEFLNAKFTQVIALAFMHSSFRREFDVSLYFLGLIGFVTSSIASIISSQKSFTTD